MSLQKTLVFLVFIGIGLLLKYKIRKKEEISGIKKIILNLALPATIFIALMGIQIKAELFLLPFLALLLNFLLFFIFPLLLPFCGIAKSTSEFRTATLLLPSLAPGLSSFPFILEYLGESYLAKAAMADLGNKVFVLVFLYLFAMRCFYRRNLIESDQNDKKSLEFFKALISEPVNILIVIALILLGLGINMDNLPVVISESLKKLSVLMTPLVLLFIGLAVSIKKGQFQKIFSILVLRAGIVLGICSIFMLCFGITAAANRLLLLAFSLSACSFWPFAHLSAVNIKEKGKTDKTFNNTMAINILALSFPFSILLILAMFTVGEKIAEVPVLLSIAGVFIVLGILPHRIHQIRIAGRMNTEKEKKFCPELKSVEADSF